jgi:hypothetical protein
MEFSEGLITVGDLAASDFDYLAFFGGVDLDRSKWLDYLAPFGSLSVNKFRAKERSGDWLELEKGLWLKAKEPGGLFRLNLTGARFPAPPELNLKESFAALALKDALGETLSGDLSLSSPEGASLGALNLNLRLNGAGRLTVKAEGPGPFFRSLLIGWPDLFAALRGIGPGEIAFREEGLASAFLANYAKRAGNKAISAEILDYGAYLESTGLLADPKGLIEEILKFVENPENFTLAWAPPEGFPLSLNALVKNGSGFPAGLDFPSAPGGQNEDFTKNLGLKALEALNLTLSVNGQKPYLFRPAPLAQDSLANK